MERTSKKHSPRGQSYSLNVARRLKSTGTPINLSGIQHLPHLKSYLVVNWDKNNLNFTANNELENYIRNNITVASNEEEDEEGVSCRDPTVLSVSREQEQFSVIAMRRDTPEHATGAAVLEVSSKRGAKSVREKINSTVYGVTATLRHMSQTEVVALMRSCVEHINDKLTSQLDSHLLKINEIENTIEELKVKQGLNRSLHHMQDIMQEIAASEHKLKELKLQRDIFRSFNDDMVVKINDVPFIAHKQVEVADELITRFDRELRRFKTALPMYAYKEKITQLIQSYPVSVIIGETGSGKSTQLAQYVYESTHDDKSQLLTACTQPRKVAATSLAKRVAEEMGTPCGQLIGYNVGMNQALSTKTRIKFLTDHALLKECLKDSNLSAYGCIIIDEAHERSIYTDLLIAMVKRILQKRKDLKVIITSATIDPKLFVEYFDGCPLMRIPGRTYPVEVFFDKEDHPNDYMQHALNKARDIHLTKPPGDILVFLPTPIETEKATEKLAALLQKENVVILPLHGQLHSTEQNKVFIEQPAGTRKIIFATNCAETSLTIHGIKYVVDSGMGKERVYDANRSVNALRLMPITKSSAEQRKGRAGRTQSGTCFRLYKEETFANLRPNTTPEIMTMHLGLAFLQLMALNIRDPTSFEFVESPPKEALAKAYSLLIRLGAVKDDQLTDLGKKLSKLGLEPRIGKFVLDGIEAGIAQEAIIISAIYSTGISLFFRPKNEQDQNEADRIKTTFCKIEGDLLTLLDVYQQWLAVEEKKKKKWCVTNSLNAKSAGILKDSVKEISYTLTNELKITPTKNFSDPNEVANTVPQLLLVCYPENIALYLGVPRGGYILPFDEMRNVHIHPSSALQYLDFNPEWIVFESILTTSRDFLITATPITRDTIEAAITRGDLSLDLKELEEKAIKPCQIETFIGNKVMGSFIGPRYSRVKALEESLCRKICGVVFIEKLAGCALVAMLEKRHHPTAQTVLKPIVCDIRAELAKEIMEVDVSLGNGIRMALQQGGTIGQILLPNQFVSLHIDSAPPSWKAPADAQTFFQTFGEVRNIVMYDSIIKNNNRKEDRRNLPNRWGKIMFSCPEEAQKAHELVTASPSDELSVSPDKASSQKVDKCYEMPFCFKVTWCRRPRKNIAMIHVKDFVFYEACINNGVTINGRRVYAGRHRPQELFVSGISTDISAKEIINSIYNSLGRTGAINESDVMLPRLAGYIDDQEKPDFQAHLEAACTEVGLRMDEFNIFVLGFGEKTFDIVSFVRIADPSKLQALRMQLRGSKFRSRGLEVLMDLTSSCMFRKEVYDVVQRDLETAMDSLKGEDSDTSDSEDEDNTKPGVQFKLELRHNSGMYRLSISANEMDVLQQCREVINYVIAPEEMKVSGDFIAFLATKEGATKKKEVEASKHVYLFINNRLCTLHIYGRQESKMQARALLERYIEYVKTLRVVEIAFDRRCPGLIKHMLRKFGIYLHDLSQKVKASRLELLLRRRRLFFQGSEKSFQMLEAEIALITSEIQKETELKLNQQTKESSFAFPDCPICFSPVEESEKYVLECCGHMYCMECVKNLLLNNITERKFPIECAAEGCTVCVAVADIKALIGTTNKDLSELIKASVDSFVMKNNGKYKYCVTPNCDAIYTVTHLKTGKADSGRKSALKCYKCEVTLCTTCHVQYHIGISCHVFKGRQLDPDYDLTLYRGRNNVVQCRCGLLIQKESGCEHLTCRCGAHLCNRCHETFNTGPAVYDHQSHCRGIKA